MVERCEIIQADFSPCGQEAEFVCYDNDGARLLACVDCLVDYDVYVHEDANGEDNLEAA